MTPGTRQRSLAWEHGVLAVERRGGMLGLLLFLLPDGRQVAPLAVAPWFSEPEAQAMDGLLPRLRGDWPCVPFGFDADRPARFGWPAASATDAMDEGHGFAANHDWTFSPDAEGGLFLAIDYPAAHPIARLEQRILPDAGAPAIDIALTVHPRRDCRLPIGLHPTFRLPAQSGSFEILFDADTAVASYPGDLDASSCFVPGEFATASAMPLRTGGLLDIRKLPLPFHTEEVVQVLDGRGGVALHNRAENYRIHLSWNAGDFPSLLLWFSNYGRQAEPWRGRHLALGVEPVCSAFDLGTAISAGTNPFNARGVRTAKTFEAGKPWTTRHRIAVERCEG